MHVIRRYGHWLLAVALAVSLGGQWAALQAVAWGTTAVQFARTEPWRVALHKTFDGRHPCQLCKAVQRFIQTIVAGDPGLMKFFHVKGTLLAP